MIEIDGQEKNHQADKNGLMERLKKIAKNSQANWDEGIKRKKISGRVLLTKTGAKIKKAKRQKKEQQKTCSAVERKFFPEPFFF